MSIHDLRCSFCGQDARGRPVMIVNTLGTGAICSKCVADCVYIVSERADERFIREAIAGGHLGATLVIHHAPASPCPADEPVKPPRPPP